MGMGKSSSARKHYAGKPAAGTVAVKGPTQKVLLLKTVVAVVAGRS